MERQHAEQNWSEPDCLQLEKLLTFLPQEIVKRMIYPTIGWWVVAVVFMKASVMALVWIVDSNKIRIGYVYFKLPRWAGEEHQLYDKTTFSLAQQSLCGRHFDPVS